MTIKEIVDSESKNKGYIILHMEGMFWKAYERSAYLFARDVKPFKVTKRFVKAVQQEIVYLGFPNDALAGYVDEKQIVSSEDKMICFGKSITVDSKGDKNSNSVTSGNVSCFPLVIENYEKWKYGISVSATAERKSSDNISVANVSNNEFDVLQRLKNIRVETVTPMDCVQLIVSLQKDLDGCL